MTGISDTDDIIVVDITGSSVVTLPAEYVRDHVRLGYAATEYGTQSGTETASATLATPATTSRGLYVAITRGQQDNRVDVVTDTTTSPRHATSSTRSSPRIVPTSRLPRNAATSPNKTANPRVCNRDVRSPIGSTS